MLIQLPEYVQYHADSTYVPERNQWFFGHMILKPHYIYDSNTRQFQEVKLLSKDQEKQVGISSKEEEQRAAKRGKLPATLKNLVRDMQKCLSEKNRIPKRMRYLYCAASAAGLFDIIEIAYEEFTGIIQVPVSRPDATLFKDRYAPVIIAYPSLHINWIDVRNTISYNVFPNELLGSGEYSYDLSKKRLYQRVNQYYRLVFSEVHSVDTMYKMPQWMQESELRFSPNHAMDIETGRFVEIKGSHGRSVSYPEIDTLSRRTNAYTRPYSIIDPLVDRIKFSYRRIENNRVYDYYKKGNQTYRVLHSYQAPQPQTTRQPQPQVRPNNSGTTNNNRSMPQVEAMGRELEIEQKRNPDGSLLVITKENGVEVSRQVFPKPRARSNRGNRSDSGRDITRPRRRWDRDHRNDRRNRDSDVQNHDRNGDNGDSDRDSDVQTDGGTEVITFDPIVVTPRSSGD